MHRSRLCSLQIDCNIEDIDAAARFWAAALDCPVDMEHSGSRDNDRQLATPPDPPMIQLQRVGHASCVHLDIETGDIEAEITRLQNLGATTFKRLDRRVVMQARVHAPSCNRQRLTARPREGPESAHCLSRALACQRPTRYTARSLTRRTPNFPAGSPPPQS